MATAPDFETACTAITKILKPTAEFIYILGSFGTPRFNEKSDIDIAVFFNKEMSWQDQATVRGNLEQALTDRNIDLISLNNIDPIFAFQVLLHGRLVFAQDSTALLKWKVKQLSIYPDFKMSRGIIEKNLLKRKTYV